MRGGAYRVQPEISCDCPRLRAGSLHPLLISSNALLLQERRPLNARELLQRTLSAGGQASGPTPPLDFTNVGTLSVVSLLSQQDMMDAASLSGQGAVAVASLASAESGTGSGYLPSSIEQLGISSIAYASSLVGNCTDLGTLIPTSIVLQGYVSSLLNNLTNAKVSSSDFRRQASSEVREHFIGFLPHVSFSNALHGNHPTS